VAEPLFRGHIGRFLTPERRSRSGRFREKKGGRGEGWEVRENAEGKRNGKKKVGRAMEDERAGAGRRVGE